MGTLLRDTAVWCRSPSTRATIPRWRDALRRTRRFAASRSARSSMLLNTRALVAMLICSTRCFGTAGRAVWRDRPAKCRAQSSDRHSRAQDHRRQHTRSFARRPRAAPSAGRISVKRNLVRIRKSLAAAALVWRQRILAARTPTTCGNSFWNEHWRRRGQRRSVDTGGIRSTLRRLNKAAGAADATREPRPAIRVACGSQGGSCDPSQTSDAGGTPAA